MIPVTNHIDFYHNVNRIDKFTSVCFFLSERRGNVSRLNWKKNDSPIREAYHHKNAKFDQQESGTYFSAELRASIFFKISSDSAMILA